MAFADDVTRCVRRDVVEQCNWEGSNWRERPISQADRIP